MPVFALRYAGIDDCCGFGQPLGGDRFTGMYGFVESASVEVPLEMKINLASDDFNNMGTKVCVMIWVPTVLTSQDLFQISRIVMVSVWSNCAPAKLRIFIEK